MLEFVIDDLKKSIIDFYNVVGSIICLYDENRQMIFSYPDCSEFCDQIKGVDALLKKCDECDRIGFDICTKQKSPYIYTCHMGLSEMIAPIMSNNVIIGYVMFGQILCNHDTNEVLNAIKAVCGKYDLSEDKMLKALEDIKHMDKKFIYSATNLMTMCVCYLYVNKIIKNKNEILEHQLKEYVDNNLFTDISIPSVCNKFFLSKSKLYHISQNVFGMGLSDYVREQRLKEAKNKLTQTRKSISQIAADVGFEDANYFSRAFKSREGMTPREYRILKTEN